MGDLFQKQKDETIKNFLGLLKKTKGLSTDQLRHLSNTISTYFEKNNYPNPDKDLNNNNFLREFLNNLANNDNFTKYLKDLGENDDLARELLQSLSELTFETNLLPQESLTSSLTPAATFNVSNRKYSAQKKNHTWLFATECQFDRKSQDMYNIDLEEFLTSMNLENPNLTYFISHKNKNYDRAFTDDNNKNAAMFKYSRFEQVNQYLTFLNEKNNKTTINNGDVYYSNIYINMENEDQSTQNDLDKIKTIKTFFYLTPYVQTNLEKCFINVEKYPLARMYMHGKVIGKIYHKIYELTNYRRRTFAFEECLTILRTMGKYRQEGDANFDQFMKSKDFWYWYSKEAMYHDEHRFKYNSTVYLVRSRDALIIQKKRAFQIFIKNFKPKRNSII